jgi:hypothetical protein
MLDIACSLLARPVVVKLLSGKLCLQTHKNNKEDGECDTLNPKQSHQINYLVAIQNQKNGEMVCCQ